MQKTEGQGQGNREQMYGITVSSQNQSDWEAIQVPYLVVKKMQFGSVCIFNESFESSFIKTTIQLVGHYILRPFLFLISAEQLEEVWRHTGEHRTMCVDFYVCISTANLTTDEQQWNMSRWWLSNLKNMY